MAKKRARSRSTTGIRPGEKASEYHQLTIRVPDSTVKLLEVATAVLGQTRWRIVHDALRAYLIDGPSAPIIPPHQRRALAELLEEE